MIAAPELAVVDLFAGPGGWDLAAHALGLDPLGIEWDAAACATRAAVGYKTRQADVAELDPLDFAPCELLIASPPCPTFSAAGSRAGGRLEHLIVECLSDLSAARDTRDTHRDAAYEVLLPDARADEEAKARRHDRQPDYAKAEARARRDAAMSMLVVEPLRWALSLSPRLIALEQVPLVLPLWERLAESLRIHGYQTWTGKLSSEQFGVPQTRERAFCLARLDGPAVPPSPTHQRYVATAREEAELDRLFDPGPRGRIVERGEEHLAPWVSMAQALGWGEHAHGRVGFGRKDDGGTATEDGYRARDFRDSVEPALVLTAKARSWTLVNGNQPNAAVRGADEPAPTVAFGHNSSGVRFHLNTGRRWPLGGTREDAQTVPLDSPAPTLTSMAGRQWQVHDERSDAFSRGPVEAPDWTEDRPATTLQGDQRVFTPGGHIANDGRDNSKMKGRSEAAVRITVPEASVLQGFPHDYPWQGTRTKQFEQIGNAVPPPFAYAILVALVA